jgi:Uncharacterized conserved protein
MQICLIGAGNLATSLAPALAEKGHRFLQVYSRSESSAGKLAGVLDCQAVVDPRQICPKADLYICALKDDALSQVLPHVDFGKGMLVHTAGSLPMDVLAAYTSNYGVFYPLQSFSKQRPVDFRTVPFFIEAAKTDGLNQLRLLASCLSEHVIPANSDQRRQLHLAAVFANNFVNYLYSIAKDLVDEKNIDFKYLLPLIQETADKLHSLSPVQAQTGPAIRFDRNVIDKHLQLLAGHSEWQSLYEALSKGIYERISIE